MTEIKAGMTVRRANGKGGTGVVQKVHTVTRWSRTADELGFARPIAKVMAHVKWNPVNGSYYGIQMYTNVRPEELVED
jgi:hypothetical protein